MATVYLQDDFRGTGGAFLASAPLAKASGVSDWGESGGTGHAIREADGLRWVYVLYEPAVVPTFFVLDATNTKGAGTFVVEIEFRGPLGITFEFDGGAQSVTVALDYVPLSATSLVVLTEASGPTTITTAAHPYSSGSTYRIRVEVSGTDLKIYEANTLLHTEAYTVAASAVIDGIYIGTYPDHVPVPTAHALINYVHAVRGGTSGPLGPVGAAGGSLATTIGEVTHFGTPATPGHVTGAAPLTGFGTPSGFLLNYATTIGFVTHFGTAVQTYNKSLAAGALAPATTFGDVESVRGPAPPPVGRVTWLAPATTFGTPAADGQIALIATGIAPNALPTPSVRMRQAATGALLATGFGTPIIGTVVRASGARDTNFGTPTTLRPFQTAGANRTAFGTPRLRIGTEHDATGWLNTHFGAASAAAAAQRTRSAVFRTSFGRAQAERFLP